MALSERDLKALRILRGVAEAGGFHAAEKKLCMTTPSISRNICALEDRINKKLCLRGPSGFELTPTGVIALQYAEKALDALDAILPALEALAGNITGDLRIGIIENTLTNPRFKLHKTLEALKDIAPSVTVSLQTYSREHLIPAVLKNEIDVAIMVLHERTNSLSYHFLFDEVQGIYCAKAVPSNIRLPLVNRNQHRIVRQVFEEYGFDVGPTANSAESVASLIATSKYYGVLPCHYADAISHVIPLRQVDDTRTINVSFYAITNQFKDMSLCVEKFITLLLEYHKGAQED